jgi:hypothetical protein
MRVVTLGISGSGEVYLTAEQIFAVCEQWDDSQSTNR